MWMAQAELPIYSNTIQLRKKKVKFKLNQNTWCLSFLSSYYNSLLHHTQKQSSRISQALMVIFLLLYKLGMFSFSFILLVYIAPENLHNLLFCFILDFALLLCKKIHWNGRRWLDSSFLLLCWVRKKSARWPSYSVSHRWPRHYRTIRIPLSTR